MDCVFCSIQKGENSQEEFILYQDDLCAAFLDQFQFHPGHVLVIPNKHYKDIFSLPPPVGANLFLVTMRLAGIVKKEFRYKGLNIYHCSGKCSVQSVFHFHLHVFPRKEGDGLFRIYPHKLITKASRLEKSSIKGRMEKHLKRL